MATYQTGDFSDFPADWTSTRYNTAGTWTVTSGDIKLAAGASGDWRCLSWNDLDGDADRGNIELLAKIYVAGVATTNYVLFARGSGADESAGLYAVGLSSTAIRVSYCAGSDPPALINSASVSISNNFTYWVRFRVNGTSIKARLWLDGDSEPGTWDLDEIDSIVTSAGWSGLAQYGTNTAPTFKALGVGTNGDTAPTPTDSAAATSLSFSPRFPRAILNF